MTFIVLFLLGLFLAVCARIFLSGVTTQEMCALIGACALIAAVSSWIVYQENILDVETLNGVVTEKKKERVSCSHYSDCNCRPVEKCSGSGKDRTCHSTTECDRCPDHAYDIDWNVYTSVNETIAIKRLTPRGLEEPPRFSSVVIGEPVAVKHRYKNYLLASTDNILHDQIFEQDVKRYEEIFQEMKYPQVFDYYRIQRVFHPGIQLANFQEWNRKLDDINSKIGSKKQANLILVLTSYPEEFFHVLRQHWKGGKKNDIILVVGTSDQLTPLWVNVMAWSTDESLSTHLRHAILEKKSLENSDEILSLFQSQVEEHYHRKPMRDFEYLVASIQPSTKQWVLSSLVMIILCGLIAWFFHTHETLGEEKKYYYKFNRRSW